MLAYHFNQIIKSGFYTGKYYEFLLFCINKGSWCCEQLYDVSMYQSAKLRCILADHFKKKMEKFIKCLYHNSIFQSVIIDIVVIIIIIIIIFLSIKVWVAFQYFFFLHFSNSLLPNPIKYMYLVSNSTTEIVLLFFILNSDLFC